MRVLYIITQGECGGAQKNVLDTAIKMKESGHKIFVCTGKQKKLDDHWLFNSLKESGFNDDELIILENLQRQVNLAQDLRAFLETHNLIEKIKPHLTHIHSTKAGIICSIAAKLAKTKVVYTVHGFVFSEKLRFIQRFFYIFSEFVASFFRDLTITVSDYDESIGKKFRIIKKNKGAVIYNGINQNNKDQILSIGDAKKIILNKTNIKYQPKKIIGTVANLYKNKGINFLIDAAKKIKDVYGKNIIFIIIGDGEEKENLKLQISKNSLTNNVFLIGNINDAFKYLKAFDLLILPSIKEGFPYILIESLLANISFIATNVGGVLEINKYNNLNLIPSGDSMALASSIINFLSSQKKESELSLPEIFTLNHMIKTLNSKYESITGLEQQLHKSKTFLITIPAYNEELIIEKTIIKINNYIKNYYANLLKNNSIKICVAINGSTDSTESIVQKMQKQITYLEYTLTKEKGRGGALDNTWKNAIQDILLYVDCDLAYDLEDLGKMINSYLNNDNYDLVVASRRLKNSIVKRHPIRTFLTEGYNILIKILFLNTFSDAQAGCKSIQTCTYKKMRNKVCSYKGWFFDTALLLYAEKEGFKIHDIVITCIDKRKWRLAIIKTIIYFLKNLVALRVKTLLKGF